jgi:hypothetical protein
MAASVGSAEHVYTEETVLKRRLAGLAVVGLMLAVAASPAAGAAPQRYTFEFEFSDTIDCSSFNPAWTFNDNFVDFFTGRGQVWLDAAGHPIRAIEHTVHRSNDVNSVTGFTLHEHNHFVALYDFVRGTVTLNGAINIMQRPGAGSVILNAGHKVFDLETGTPLVLAGPDRADDEDFCRAVAP